MANELLSKTMVISLDGNPIARTTGFSFNVDKETVDVTSFDSTSSWKEFLVDLKEAEISFDGLVSRDSSSSTNDYETLLTNIMTSDASVAFLLDDSAAPTDITGAGYLTNVSLTGSLGDKQTYSGTLKPTGPISIA